MVIDVLVVGAGPTGLALAAQLARFGVRPRVIDRGHERVHESRALGIQPRTLEVLAPLGVTGELVARGNRGLRLRLHVGRREFSMPAFDIGLGDTAYPYLLFLSQAETERILEERLARAGVTVERGVELVESTSDSGHGDGPVTTMLRHDDGREETVRARYVVGCDGAHSTVRRLAGIAFAGGAYPQTFVLADLEADGIEPGSVHVFLSEPGILFFFPLGKPATWRLIAMRPPADQTPVDTPVTLDEVQGLADAYCAVPGGNGRGRSPVRLADPVWMTNFRLHHRAATRYRAGPLFLAGDAAHIHSPAGAQGMNTGIQDATNLAWKLAYTLRGLADPAVLDTYEPEREPVGRYVLRFTDRAFTAATSASPLVRFVRTRVVPMVLPLALKARAGRAYAFRTVSQLKIRYRDSPLSTAADDRRRTGPRPGDRLPDAPIVHDGQSTTLHAAVAEPCWHLVLCGPPAAWPVADLTALSARFAGVVAVHHLTAEDAAGVLCDPHGHALRRLGGTGPVQYLVRPDGHIGFRAGGTSLTALTRYLDRWLPAQGP